MRDILRITIGLTISCLIAALIMGSVFTVTDKAKKHNEHMDIQNTMLGLLGYSKTHPAPAELSLHPVYRYIIDDKGTKFLGYMVPAKKAGKEMYELLLLDLAGTLKQTYDLQITPDTAVEITERETAIRQVIKPPTVFTYADSFIVAMLGKKRLAYLIPGEFPGFKTFVRVMLALDPSFTVKGLDILEQEEDPGLGGEIVRDYFKNQFIGKTYDKLKSLKVVKKPLPEEYRQYLEREKQKKGMFTEEQLENIRKKYRDSDIYALTGATISSQSVTTGIKTMVKKFAYRTRRLDQVIAQQHIPVSF
ncbi:MAG: FMN-binding protein [Deltaproteobacteria bacterium]|nr:MAG: FMN-binding protein [Deltaproteobacteria bacterium]